MQISYKKAIACFKELNEKHLVWEQRQGRGLPNRIYLAEVVFAEKASFAYDCAPFSANENRPAENAAKIVFTLTIYVLAPPDEPHHRQYGLYTQMITFLSEITALSYQVAVIEFVLLQNLELFVFISLVFLQHCREIEMKSTFHFDLPHGRYYRPCRGPFFTARSTFFSLQNKGLQ